MLKCLISVKYKGKANLSLGEIMQWINHVTKDFWNSSTQYLEWCLDSSWKHLVMIGIDLQDVALSNKVFALLLSALRVD